jgi:hypothetical protein
MPLFSLTFFASDGGFVGWISADGSRGEWDCVVQPDRQGFGTTLLKGMFSGILFDYLEGELDCTFDLELRNRCSECD